MKYSRTILAVLIAAGLNCVAFAQTETEKLLAESNPAIQAQIRAAYKSQNEVEAFQQTQTLKEMTNDKAELVKQLAIFAATSQSEEDVHVLVALRILYRLELQPSIPIRVFAPYLASNNRQLQDFAQEWFEGYVEISGDGPFKAYSSYVSSKLSRDEEVPEKFVEYIYALSPGQALLAFHRGNRARDLVPTLKAMGRNLQTVQQQMGAVEMPPPQVGEPSGNVARLTALARKLAAAREQAEVRDQVELPQPRDQDREIRLAEHIVSNAIWLNMNGFGERFQQALPEAKEQLAKLSEHSEWWVRLYVAEIMRQHRELRQTEFLEKLSHDDNELVSNAAKSMIK